MADATWQTNQTRTRGEDDRVSTTVDVSFVSGELRPALVAACGGEENLEGATASERLPDVDLDALNLMVEASRAEDRRGWLANVGRRSGRSRGGAE